MFIGLGLVLTGCGISDSGQNIKNNGSEWETIETVSGRNIIAKLEQGDVETPERDKMVENIKESREFTDGSFGEPSDELAEEMAVQQVEGSIVIPLLEEFYGGRDGLDKIGVIFFENKSSGAEQSGLWFGVKEPDERLQELVNLLQERVDAGEIKARYVYIYKSPHTQTEINELSDEVFAVAREFQEKHETPNRVSIHTSVDTITGEIHIGHNFLTEEQQKAFIDKFSNNIIKIVQDGPLAPKDGEPDTIYPESEFTNVPSKEGAYIMEIANERILVIDAAPQDFSKTGGIAEFYSAIYYSFPDASKKLKVGQRVKVDASGGIMESYPAQGTALYVTVLPEYKPDGAKLSESEVIRMALEEINITEQLGFHTIRDISYDQENKRWTVQFKDENEVIEIEDK